MEKQIIIIKPKSLSPKDKEKLTKAGNIVIEHEKAFEISFHPHQETMQYVFTCCYTCGERIYMTTERMTALKTNHHTFYCSQGHSQVYKKTT